MINIDIRKKLYLAAKYPKTAYHEILDKFNPNSPTPFPRFVNCFITERCNFNCPMCHVINSRLKNLTELSFSDLKVFFDQISPYTPSVSLAGGEPLMHPDIIKIISYLSSKHMVKGLVSNGMLLDKKAQDLLDAGLDFLAISLDGPDEKTQFKRGNVRNSFDMIVKGLDKMVKIRGHKILPNIRIATVITKANIDNFDEIFKIVKNLGVDQWSISHHFYYFDKVRKLQEKFGKENGFGTDIWGEDNGKKRIFFNSSERKLITEKLSKIKEMVSKADTKIKITFPNSDNVEKFYTGAIPNKKSVCTSPFNQIYLRGNGDVEMCHGYILGNVKETNLKDIWTNDKTLKFQKYKKEHITIPACFRCCSLNPVFD